LPTHVLGVTAFSEVMDKHAAMFADFTWALVLYEPANDEWSQRLARKCEYIAGSKRIAGSGQYDYDIAIVTALHGPELEEVRALKAGWDRHSVECDDTLYYRGVFADESKKLRVVAACAIQMGMPAATGLAMKMCFHFRPRYLLMTGIAAGVDGNVGDILIADRAWDYGSGKSKATGAGDGTAFGGATFEPAPTAIPLDAGVLEKVKPFSKNKDVLKKIEFGWSGDPRPPKALGAHVGPIASGAAVLENRPLIDAIMSHDRKLIGVEMEAYGIFLAARIGPAPRPKAIVIKSICDCGAVGKKDKWQQYAAYTSTQFAYEFALREL
jgi:nucleoside phosphorylase